MGAFIDAIAGTLRDDLPSWWAKDRPGSELYLLCQTYGELADALTDAIEGIYADQGLMTARDEALRREWAVLYGAGNEQLPLATETLRAYLTARSGEDGSITSLEDTLLSLLRNSSNDVGTPLTFPAGGSGLTFPANGAGLTLFQTSTERGYLRFPADGSGLTFPAGGAGLVFPTTSRLEVRESFADHRIDVTVRDYLVFDRPAFARAVGRFRQAHMVPPTIKETTV